MTNVSHTIKHLSFSDGNDGKFHRKAADHANSMTQQLNSKLWLFWYILISFVFRGDAFRTIERCLQGWSRFPREAHHRHRAKSSRKVVALRSWEVSIEIDSGHCVAVCLAFWFVEQVTRNVASLDGQRFTFGAQKSLRLESSPTRWWTPENLSQNLHVPFSVQLFQKVWTFVRIPWSVWKLATLFQLQDDPRLQPWELLRTTSFHQAYIHDLKAFFSSNMLKCLVSSLCFLAGPLLLSICKALLQQSIHLVATARFSGHVTCLLEQVVSTVSGSQTTYQFQHQVGKEFKP